MLEYNKFLKNVRKPYDYPFKEMSEQNTIEDKIRIGTWNLDNTITLTLITYFKAFKKYMNGFPMGYEEINSFEDWENIIDEIIKGLEYYACHGKCYDNKVCIKASKKLKKSLKLMMKYYEALWW